MSAAKFSNVAEKTPELSEPVVEDKYLPNTNRISGSDKVRRISTKELCQLFRHLAALLRSGLQVVPALSALVEQLAGSPLAEVVADVADRVTTGSRLSVALSRYPDIFSSFIVNMVAAGEGSGNLEGVLLRLSDILEKKVKLAGKVKAAIAYPLMMIIVAMCVVVFLLSFVVPSLTNIFTEMGRDLPWPTRLLIFISSFMRTYFWLVLTLIFAASIGFATWLRTAKGRDIWDSIKLKIPLFGKLILRLEIARLARTLGILLTNGIPLLDALEITKGVIQNNSLAKSLELVKTLIRKGDNIANSIKKTGFFPPIVYHILSTGQAGGNIEEGLINIADIYDNEVEVSSKTLTSLLEPAILLIMGAFIGFIVLAILLPIFEINTVI